MNTEDLLTFDLEAVEEAARISGKENEIWSPFDAPDAASLTKMLSQNHNSVQPNV